MRDCSLFRRLLLPEYTVVSIFDLSFQIEPKTFSWTFGLTYLPLNSAKLNCLSKVTLVLTLSDQKINICVWLSIAQTLSINKFIHCHTHKCFYRHFSKLVYYIFHWFNYDETEIEITNRCGCILLNSYKAEFSNWSKNLSIIKLMHWPYNEGSWSIFHQKNGLISFTFRFEILKTTVHCRTRSIWRIK